MAEGARLESVFTGNRNVGSNPTPSASPSATNILRWGFGALKSPITTGFAHKPPHCDTPAETRNSFSPAVCLQTSRLRGFSTELVSD